MIVAIDTNCLVAWSSKQDPESLARLNCLLDEIRLAKGKVIIPTPVIAEYLVLAEQAGIDWLQTLERQRGIVIAPFDKRAAIECSFMDILARNSGDKRAGRTEPWQRIKIDRQIIGISKVQNASTIISNDKGLRTTAFSVGLHAISIPDLALPDSARQVVLPLPDPPSL